MVVTKKSHPEWGGVDPTDTDTPIRFDHRVGVHVCWDQTWRIPKSTFPTSLEVTKNINEWYDLWDLFFYHYEFNNDDIVVYS